MNAQPVPPSLVTSDSVIDSGPWLKWLKTTGLLKDGDRVRRVIIDIERAHHVRVWLEKYGDELLTLAPPKVT